MDRPGSAQRIATVRGGTCVQPEFASPPALHSQWTLKSFDLVFSRSTPPAENYGEKACSFACKRSLHGFSHC